MHGLLHVREQIPRLWNVIGQFVIKRLHHIGPAAVRQLVLRADMERAMMNYTLSRKFTTLKDSHEIIDASLDGKITKWPKRPEASLSRMMHYFGIT